MRAALFWIAVAIAAVVLVLFAVSNRTGVELSVWPVPFMVTLPAYLLVFTALALGFVVGWLAAWFGRWRLRRESHLRCRRIEALERELAATQAQLDRSGTSGSAELAVHR